MAGHAATAGPPSRDALDWPFFEDRHRTLATDLDAFIAKGGLGSIDHSDADGACKKLVKALGAGGFLKACVPAAYGGASEVIDSRALC
ncbi:MAG: acyl-CoA dehydrogenase family protein, partial [Mesorhizobium sp.]